MRKKICKCGKIVDENDLCCRKKDMQQKSRRWDEDNVEEAKFRHSTRWKKWRLVILERDNYHCQRCLIKYGILETERLEVHHIKSRKNYPHLRWETDNLITCCKTCNNQLGTSDVLDFKPNINLTQAEDELYKYKFF